ncbi:MAG: AAA family ATPase [Candidatus Promineifilaceae bacterium]
MKLIVIHGAEATGKLTVAKQLSAKTDFCIFHNHISVDFVRTLFDFGEEHFSPMIWDARSIVFEYAAKAQLDGLIFTWAFSYPDFLPHLERIQAIVSRFQRELCLVYLSCTHEERLRRITAEERKLAGKIHTVEELNRQATKKNYHPVPNSLEIDNTNLSPQQVADLIIQHFTLAHVAH